ncbi:MAG: DeoR/GlpR family DNA-binding transcription regulator [Muribaculaceae bacterium]|nr:DeoR/GlpR family DNA-binding transcription regulator [Muribaculaceae bacterium]
MTKDERHNLIIQILLRQESASVGELSSQLQVSAVTIRKDLSELEAAKKLYRSHGTAILIDPYINNRSISEKAKLASHEKSVIGYYAAQLINRDDSIIIASGTTMLSFAHSIEPNHHLTVVSASLKVSEALGPNEAIDVIQLGGTLRRSSLSVVGRHAEEFLEDMACSKLFMGVDGFDPNFGITTTDIREADLNKAMMRAARKTIVLADSSKFGRSGFVKIADFDEIDMIITDSNLPDKAAQVLESMGVDLRIAEL